ncbi:MAG TPA: hypothetical protein H9815_04300 [Candidatus Ruania gallistercoris]|uniref:Uncharacterized protein n=1 Tax=Candidatus Ruania gallistercoris TaxID=2838746 RepID=A0A9D2ECP5_9MICO|nr:hypothetical protein [Candidatus Ruania gallistercoris]
MPYRSVTRSVCETLASGTWGFLAAGPLAIGDVQPHDLGHLILHASYADEDAETQAIEFAAEFLMHRGSFSTSANR